MPPLRLARKNPSPLVYIFFRRLCHSYCFCGTQIARNVLLKGLLGLVSRVVKKKRSVKLQAIHLALRPRKTSHLCTCPVTLQSSGTHRPVKARLWLRLYGKKNTTFQVIASSLGRGHQAMRGCTQLRAIATRSDTVTWYIILGLRES